ncbi:DMT family transporter [Bacillus tamaricis]|uniref:DMT family transporter n=1 Tax=Evansella tamaricis TaxID=2069301 RepID=A0ABS6JJ35_9BACI|nr:DMT family transporter [Evansella tamaricis]
MSLSRLLTYCLLVFVMFTWGLNVVAVKVLVNHFPPVLMQSFRILLAGIIAITVLYFLRDLRKLTWKEWGLTILAAGFGQMLHHSLLAIGLVETTAANGALILGLIPLTTSVLAMFFFRETLTRLKFLGIILGLTGVAFVVLQTSSDLGGISKGDLYIFISMLSQSISFIVIKKITATLSSRQMTAIMLLVGSIFLLVLSIFLEPNGTSQIVGISSSVWIIFILSAVFATGIGHILYNTAIHHIGAGKTAIFNNLVPFFALVGSFLFLKEPISLSQIIGFVLIVLGVVLGTGYMDTYLQQRIKKVGKDTTVIKRELS